MGEVKRMRRQPLPMGLAPISRPKRPNEPVDKVRRCVRRHLKASEGKDIQCSAIADELKMPAAEVARLWDQSYWGIVVENDGPSETWMLGEDGE